MKLYHISQDEVRGYDTFSDMVVCAESEDEARKIHPATCSPNSEDPWSYRWSGWSTSPEQVKVKYLGEAADDLEKGIICSSFHAG